jgi:hypothetical protein
MRCLRNARERLIICIGAFSGYRGCPLVQSRFVLARLLVSMTMQTGEEFTVGRKLREILSGARKNPNA